MPFACQSIRTIIYSPLIKNRVTRVKALGLSTQTHHVRPDCMEEVFEHLQVTLEPFLCRPLPFRNSVCKPIRSSDSRGLCGRAAACGETARREVEVEVVLTCSECVSSKGRVRPN